MRVHVLNSARDLLAIEREGDKELKPWSFHKALQHVNQEGKGVVVLICHSETTAEIEESIDWMLSGKQIRPSQDMVYKQVGTGSQILRDIGVRKMRLMSAPFRFSAISGFALEVVESISNPQ